ncbi:type II toxin-antitoxin system VapC family toxin [Falsiroseomonas sp. HW251]|uniref:type II toxin-antitoxin system VapC family toxin n=1 Tax=Falsiroseomonas sp. HW251 TaxID=3390998 RepID=UPI003D314C1B
MIVDTSAICAILFAEKEEDLFLDRMVDAPKVRISAATLVEATMVVEGRSGPDTTDVIDTLLAQVGAEICPITPETARIARDGWRRFGKGRHKAALNLGDCFAYALAIERDEPLLFKGEDFAATNVKRAL